MAQNIARTGAPVVVELAVTSLTSGQVGVLGTGKLPYVAMESTGASVTGKTALALAGVTFTIEDTVTGADHAGASAVALGDKLYKDGAEINKDATDGDFLGYALGTVVSGSAASIEIALVSPLS